MDAAEKCIPKKKRVKKRVPWEKELVKEKRNELKKAYLKNQRLPNSDNANYLKQAKEELQAANDSEQVEYLAQKCAEIENAAVQHQAKRVQDTINEITGRTSSATGGLIKAKLLR